MPSLRSMRAHLLLVIVCAMAPLAILPIIGIWVQHRRDEQRAQMEVRWAAEVGARDLATVLSLTGDLARNFDREAHLRMAQPDKCDDSILDRFRLAFPFSTGMGIVRPDGVILCSTPPASGIGPIDRFWYPSTIDRSTVAEYRRGPVSGAPILAVAHWVSAGSGRLLVVGIDAKRLQAHFARLVVPDGVTAVALDRNGVAFAASGEHAPAPGTTFFEPGVVHRAGLLGRKAQVLTGRDGVEREYVFAPVAAGLTVAAGMPTAPIERQAYRQVAISAAIIAATTLLVLVVARAGVRRFLLEPLQVFSGAASRVAGGDYSSRLGTSFPTELGGLAGSFDRMTASLERETLRNRKAAAAFRALVEATSGEAGAGFFKSFVLHIAGILDMRYAFVGELVDESRVRTLAVCDDGRIAENFSYDLKDTPCEEALAKGICKVPRSVQARYPNDQLLAAMRVESYMASPLRDADGRVTGIIAVMDTRPLREETALDAMDVLRVFSSRAALEIERGRAIAALERSIAERDDALRRLEAMVRQFKALTARREKIREQERTRVAKEVHDELGQQLTLMKFEYARMRRGLKFGHDTDEILAEFPGIIDRAIETVRRIATELRPGILDNFGLAATLGWQAEQFSKRTGIECRFSELAEAPLDSNVSTALFRIFQEALTNVARHSGATRVEAALRYDGCVAVLEMADNGRGIDQSALGALNTTGLLGMRERAEMLGGTLLIQNTSGGGARVVATVPAGLASDTAVGGAG